jgi:hypothetical protein
MRRSVVSRVVEDRRRMCAKIWTGAAARRQARPPVARRGRPSPGAQGRVLGILRTGAQNPSDGRGCAKI